MFSRWYFRGIYGQNLRNFGLHWLFWIDWLVWINIGCFGFALNVWICIECSTCIYRIRLRWLVWIALKVWIDWLHWMFGLHVLDCIECLDLLVWIAFGCFGSIGWFGFALNDQPAFIGLDCVDWFRSTLDVFWIDWLVWMHWICIDFY
jgi:hypothetical protein